MSERLFKIDLGYPLGEFYAVAKDPTTAYKKVRADLDNEDYGFRKDREMETIELIAEATRFPDCVTRLIL